MKRLYIPALVMLLIAGAARAEGRHCYVLWETQCFEVHDAQSRDITHHLLMTDGPIRLEVQGDSCEIGSPLLDKEQRQALRNAFARHTDDIDGCQLPDQLDRRVEKHSEPLVERFQRLKESNKRRKVHILDPPEPGS